MKGLQKVQGKIKLKHRFILVHKDVNIHVLSFPHSLLNTPLKCGIQHFFFKPTLTHLPIPCPSNVLKYSSVILDCKFFYYTVDLLSPKKKNLACMKSRT